MIKLSAVVNENLNITDYLKIIKKSMCAAIQDASNDDFRGMLSFYGGVRAEMCGCQLDAVIISESEYLRLKDAEKRLSGIREYVKEQAKEKKEKP